MRGNLQNAVNQEVAYHKVTDQVARALPYGNVNNQDGAHQTETPNEFRSTCRPSIIVQFTLSDMIQTGKI